MLKDQDLIYFKSILNKRKIEDSELNMGIKLIKKTGALEKARQRAEIYSENGLKLLSSLKNTRNTEFLKELFTFSLNRVS